MYTPTYVDDFTFLGYMGIINYLTDMLSLIHVRDIF